MVIVQKHPQSKDEDKACNRYANLAYDNAITKNVSSTHFYVIVTAPGSSSASKTLADSSIFLKNIEFRSVRDLDGPYLIMKST